MVSPHSNVQSALAGGNWEQLRIQFSPWGPILRSIMGAHYKAQKFAVVNGEPPFQHAIRTSWGEQGTTANSLFPLGLYSALHNGRPLWSAKVNGEPPF